MTVRIVRANVEITKGVVAGSVCRKHDQQPESVMRSWSCLLSSIIRYIDETYLLKIGLVTFLHLVMRPCMAGPVTGCVFVQIIIRMKDGRETVR